MLYDIIKGFFKEHYQHSLNDNLTSYILSSIEGKIDELEIAFFLDNDYTPLKRPDEKFSTQRVFSLLENFQLLMVEHKKNDYTQVFLKGILLPLVCNISRYNSQLLSEYLKNNTAFRLYKTKYFTLSLLGKSEFNIARSFNDVDNELSEKYFRKSLNSLLEARKLGFNPNDRFNFGMVGVCHYYIAISANDPEIIRKEFKDAIRNLESAENLGDVSRDHFQYLGNSLFEYACFENKLEDYLKALDKLYIVFQMDSNNSNSIISLASVSIPKSQTV